MHSARKLSVAGTTTVVLAIAIGASATLRDGNAQGLGDENYEPRPCPATFTAALGVAYQNKTWGTQTWDKTGTDLAFNQAKYIGVGQFLDSTERWEWLDPKGTFTCGRINVVPGQNPVWVNTYEGSNLTGNVVPHGEEESEQTQHPGGGGGPYVDDGTWYVCWYWRYPDGSRSAYYYCEPM